MIYDENRQTGRSSCEIFDAITYADTHKNVRVVYYSHYEKAANLFFKMAMDLISWHQIYTNSYSKKKIIFENGSQLIFKSIQRYKPFDHYSDQVFFDHYVNEAW